MTAMMRITGSIILCVFVILHLSITVDASDDGTVVNQSSPTTNDELAEKLDRLEDRLEKEISDSNNRFDQLTKALDDANGKIFLLEENNIKLTQELIDARGKITYLEREEEIKTLTNANVNYKPSDWNKDKLYLMSRSCAEARSADPTIQSGNYYVDPDGTNIGDDPIYVYCDMITGVTLVSHDSEATIDVGNCNTPGCYTRAINYAGRATTKQLAALVDLSTSCRQSIRYDCFSAPFELNGVVQSWWNDRNGVERYFWAGANNEHTCQCGIDNNCVDPSQKCNCDAMAVVQLTDNGYVTEKNSLPVTRLNFGRIAAGASGKHTLGKFECSGRTVLKTMPTNCYDLFIAGNVISGFYTVKGSSIQLRTVYCDYDKAPGATGYETVIGFIDVKTASGVSFYVQRDTWYSFNRTVIPYEVERLNIGSAMNLASGVFTAPVNGRYHFSFTAFSITAGDTSVSLRVNGVNMGISDTHSQFNNLPIVATLNLKKGDTVDTYLNSGSLYEGSVNYWTQFSGILLDEDLVLS